MKISVTFKNTEAEIGSRNYVEERLEKLKKHIDSPAEIHVVLSVEKFRSVAEVNLLAKGMSINAKGEAKDMLLAIDNVIEKIERQIKKRRGKTRDRKAGASTDMDISSIELPPEDYEEPEHSKVVEVKRIVLNPMSLEDAVMEMETSKNKFIMYRDSFSEKVSVIYRRRDGSYALIEANS